MNRVNFYLMFVLLASAVLFGSCSDDESEPVMKKITLHGVYSDEAMNASSRIALDKGTKNFLWEAGDVVYVYDASKTSKYKVFTLTEGTGTNNGTFECEIPESETFVPARLAFIGENFLAQKGSPVWNLSIVAPTGNKPDTYVETFGNDGGNNLKSVFATAKVMENGGKYSFVLNHLLGYAVFDIKNTADQNWTDGRRIRVYGNIYGNANFNWDADNGETPLNPSVHGADAGSYFEINSDASEVRAFPINGTVTKITVADGKKETELWSGSRTVGSGKIVNFKKDFNVQPQ